MVASMKINSSHFSRQVRAELSQIEELCGDLKTLLNENNLSQISFCCELLLREAFNNAVLHGAKNDIRQKILVEANCTPEFVILSIEDEGLGFDWQKLKKLPMADYTATSGRGISLCKCYASKVEFNAKGNRVTLQISTTSTPS